MEDTVEEVDSVASENTVTSETPGEGNLTMAELASNLLKSRTKEESPEPTEEESESVDQDITTTEEEESEEQSVEEQEESEQTEPPAQPSDVLSKYNIDIDSLSEEEARELADAFQSGAMKRFAKLTEQKYALKQQNENLQNQIDSKQSESVANNSNLPTDNALANVNDISSLEQEVENFNALVEWAEESLDNEVEYDDSGNEYLVKEGDKTYTKDELRRIRSNAKKILRKDVPARHKFIVEREQYDKQALETFPFLGDGESEDYQIFMQAKNHKDYKQVLNNLPNGNYIAGLMIEGMRSVEKRQKEASKPKPKPKAPVASAEAGTAKPRSENSQRKKALQVAKSKFDQTGDMTDFKHYIKLKRETA
tara:strand:- start:82 stop:1182 length:1101 start_codon:yes stop_codon:yes gene_type:complete